MHIWIVVGRCTLGRIEHLLNIEVARGIGYDWSGSSSLGLQARRNDFRILQGSLNPVKGWGVRYTFAA